MSRIKQNVPTDDYYEDKEFIRTWRKYQPSRGEINSGELLVIPDQAYSIEEIFDKFRRGISLPIELETHYIDGDEDDFDNIDLRQIAKDPYDLDESTILHRFKRGTHDAKEENNLVSPDITDKKEDGLQTETGVS